MIHVRTGYTFDDLALVPQYNNVPSRQEPKLETWLTKNILIDMPILYANMESISSPALAKIFLEYGGAVIHHRFESIENQLYFFSEASTNAKGNAHLFASCGINTSLDDLKLLYNQDIITGIVFDVAHGHSASSMNYIEALKSLFDDISIVAGNVCTANGYIDLVNAGADAVKVGIGGGAACTTRGMTGVGVPQMTAIMECAEVAKKYKVPIIADGGVRGSADIAKALAAGASTVMVGKLFAATKESAALKTFDEEGQALMCRYRGQASESFQNDFYGGLKENTVPEGEEGWIPCRGSAKDVLDNLLGGLRSAMTYMGSRSIKEMQNKAEFIHVTPTYGIESNTRLY